MSVRAYHLRRVAYRKTQGPVGIPGKPSTTNRKARRRDKQPACPACDGSGYDGVGRCPLYCDHGITPRRFLDPDPDASVLEGR